ncbi:MAG: hypothetical protein MJ075_02455 [Oscillospiraceae bacterium]|nr:hypothetical protein [Oscillospiraceae bacterium]
MIDMHCHILPGVDDGSPNLEETLAMAAMAEASGVTDIVATPHFQYSLAEAEGIKEKLAKVNALTQQAIARKGLKLRLHTGSEVLCSKETPELLRRGLLPTIGNTDYLLIEFRFHTHLRDMEDMIERLSAEGARLIIAHPERYVAVQHNRDALVRWFHEGYILQVNKGSVLGSLGNHARQTSRWILDHGLAHIVASDAHTAQVRTPRLTELREALEHYWDEDYAEVLLEINPARLLAGKDVLSPDGEDDEEEDELDEELNYEEE